MIWLQLGVVAVLALGVYLFKESYDKGKIDEGVHACQAANREKTAQLVLDYTKMDEKADKNAKERDDALKALEAERRKRAVAVAHSDVAIPADLAGVLHGTDSERGHGGNESAAATSDKAMAGLPEAAAVYDAADIARWATDARGAYDSCVADDVTVRERYDGAREAQIRRSR